jgi:hypothetical protein
MAMAQVLATFIGYISSIEDVNLLLDACIQGVLPLVPRRLRVGEHSMLIKSGSTFVYDESASHIKRWTDGRFWGSRRSLGDFYIYRELERSKGSTLKEAGLVRKMISYSRDGVSYGLVSYFTEDDVQHGVLTTPSASMQSESLDIYNESCPESQDLVDMVDIREQLYPLTMTFPPASHLEWETVQPWLDRDANFHFDHELYEEANADSVLFMAMNLS